MTKRKSKPPTRKKKSNHLPDQDSPQDPPKVERRQKERRQLEIRGEQFAGPLPPPIYLKEYESISSGFADRIISMAENEALHRREIENKSLDAEIEISRREFAERRIGQFCGLIIGLAALGAGTICAVNGQPMTGIFMGTGGVVALVTAFIYGKVSERQKEDSNS